MQLVGGLTKVTWKVDMSYTYAQKEARIKVLASSSWEKNARKGFKLAMLIPGKIVKDYSYRKKNIKHNLKLYSALEYTHGYRTLQEEV